MSSRTGTARFIVAAPSAVVSGGAAAAPGIGRLASTVIDSMATGYGVSAEQAAGPRSAASCAQAPG